MLRNLLPPEPYLIKLINEKKWEQVKLRVRTHPKDATPNHSAYRGIGPTALVLAVRGGAELDTCVAITKASLEQLVQVKHHRYGTVLHEAIKCDASVDLILYFINTIVKYETDQVWNSRGELKPILLEMDNKASNSPIAVSRFNDRSMSPNRLHTHSTLFNLSDGLGRSPLHYLIERAVSPRDNRDNIMCAVQKLVNVFPPAIGKRDSDGYTPLDIALIARTTFDANNDLEIEMRIYGICSILVKKYPMAAFPHFNSARAKLASPSFSSDNFRLPLPVLPTTNDTDTGHLIAKSRRYLSEAVQGNIAHNPLSHALMHGRHLSTIELLLEASKLSQTSWHTGHLHDWNECQREHSDGLDSCCMAMVSRDFEVPLHICATMRAAADVVQQMLLSAPKAAMVPDRCSLTPICWTWIRHVIEENDRSSFKAEHPGSQFRVVPAKASKRRIIPKRYSEFNGIYTEELANMVKSFFGDESSTSIRSSLTPDERYEWQKFSVLLPAAAESIANAYPEDSTVPSIEFVESWSPLHSACILDCPRGVVLLAVLALPLSARHQDSLGNLPLHYAASRCSYKKAIPLGATSIPRLVCDTSPVMDVFVAYPGAIKVMNVYGQLPLHIAIDAEKRSRLRRDNAILSRIHQGKSIDIVKEPSTTLSLSRVDPESLEYLDGISGLYPFAQAASGENFSLDTIYLLLRECPSLI